MQNFFFIRDAGLNQKVEFGEIVYVEAYKNYCKIVTGKKTYTVLASLKKIESILPAGLFCRVHRSYIISLEKMTAFDNHSVHLLHHHIPVGDLHRRRLTESVTVLHREDFPRNEACLMKSTGIL